MSTINIDTKLKEYSATSGDINQHLFFLKKLSSDCESILSCCMQSVIPSYAFLSGLLKSSYTTKQLVSCNFYETGGISTIDQACKENNIDHVSYRGNSLNIPMMKKFDMVFIATWHVYAQLKRELEKFHSHTNKYIVMHDTEVDKDNGESIRCGLDIAKQSADSGFSESDIRCGLKKAIDEFLLEHPEWRVKIHLKHNNGLTVLERF